MYTLIYLTIIYLLICNYKTFQDNFKQIILDVLELILLPIKMIVYIYNEIKKIIKRKKYNKDERRKIFCANRRFMF